jgi:hypothetical protein
MTMEFTNAEICVVEETVNNAEAQIKELGDLQLALVGGGNGDVIFA